MKRPRVATYGAFCAFLAALGSLSMPAGAATPASPALVGANAGGSSEGLGQPASPDGASVAVAMLAADGPMCGNGCSTTQDDGIECTDWAPGAAGQSCQAKAMCTGTDCTVWGTRDSPPRVRELLADHESFRAERFETQEGFGVYLTPLD